MKNVIVTGANGFIGSALVKELATRDINIVAIVRNEEKAKKCFAELPNITIVRCQMEEIAELPARLPTMEYDACFHLAWEGSFGPERADYEMQLKNVRHTLNVVDVCNQLNVKRFIGIGTLAEKDIEKYLPYDGASPAPVSLYGIAKRTAHHMVKTQCTKHKMDYAWCILSNTYGVGNTTNNFINMASSKMLNGERAAFTAGEQMYDFLYITDAARAIADVGEYGKTATDYFIGSTTPRQLKEYIRMIRDEINPAIPLYLGEIPFNGVTLDADDLSTEKLQRDTPYTPSVPFEEGIRRTVAWLRERN